MAFVSILSESSRQGKRVYISSDSLGVFGLDIVNNELHESKLRTTENPIESGATVADHAIVEPKQLTMTGIIVAYSPNNRFNLMDALGLPRVKPREYPIPTGFKAMMGGVESTVDRVDAVIENFLATSRNIVKDERLNPNIDVKKFDESSTADRIATAYNALLNMQAHGGFLNVVTHAKGYKNMLITSISMTQKDALSASLTLTFKEVIVANTQKGTGFVTSSNLGRVKPKEVKKSIIKNINENKGNEPLWTLITGLL